MSRKLGALTTAGVLGLTLLIPQAAGAVTNDAASRDAVAGTYRAAPIGVWTGTVTFPTGQVEATMSFHANGKVCLLTPPPGPDGGVEGQGTWQSTGPHTFTFKVTERFFDGAGTTTGYLRATHNATLRGNVFTTVGDGAFYDADWKEQNTFTATSNMRRKTRTVSC
ncbi:hypothetical protein J7E87_02870 [Streptomyces sp. ISL-1]|uniref:hypothetical protein n=1 Tax=Streptomyces sp. ISL-1 TaxID=2817657 RepID=UPI001BE5EE7B|nr:hypothetical protein [Streptomyces sp. ISL-1]MBT2388379.1 hypothetical protein [Streptomyces sp. ISL-1]